MLNPILERELKTRMRTWKTPILLTVYLFLIGMILTLILLSSNVTYGYRAQGFDPSIISTVYDVLVIFQMILLMLIIPVFTATAISGERERQTLDLMLCTDISPWKILFGKISAALTFILLIIFASIPFISIIMLFGGVSIFDILKVVLYYMVAAFMLSTVGIFATTHFKRNITAIMMSYIILGLIYFIPIVLMIILSIVTQVANMHGLKDFFETYIYEIVAILFGANPGFGLLSLLNNDPFELAYMMINRQTFLSHLPTWVISLVYFAIISSIALLLSKRKLSKR
jgi:ABC-type transport system involved in multi-copper enzyme maturation permease subunit